MFFPVTVLFWEGIAIHSSDLSLYLVHGKSNWVTWYSLFIAGILCSKPWFFSVIRYHEFICFTCFVPDYGSDLIVFNTFKDILFLIISPEGLKFLVTLTIWNSSKDPFVAIVDGAQRWNSSTPQNLLVPSIHAPFWLHCTATPQTPWNKGKKKMFLDISTPVLLFFLFTQGHENYMNGEMAITKHPTEWL